MNESKPTGKRPDDVPGLMRLGKLISEREEVPAVDFPVPTEEIIARYEKLYTGAVSDVLREQGLLFQALPPGLQCLRPERTVAGFAFTVKSAPNVMIRGEMDIRTRMLDELRPGGFVVWDSTDDVSATLWGGVMTAAATRAGVRAACISGGIRDTHQILQKDFPVFYKHRSPNGSLGRCMITHFQIPIQLGSVLIRPGDLVLGDIDGVIIVPRALVMRVLERAEEVLVTEDKIFEWVNSGETVEQIKAKGGYF